MIDCPEESKLLIVVLQNWPTLGAIGLVVVAACKICCIGISGAFPVVSPLIVACLRYVVEIVELGLLQFLVKNNTIVSCDSVVSAVAEPVTVEFQRRR
jgi:hypothetical protein